MDCCKLLYEMQGHNWKSKNPNLYKFDVSFSNIIGNWNLVYKNSKNWIRVWNCLTKFSTEMNPYKLKWKKKNLIDTYLWILKESWMQSCDATDLVVTSTSPSGPLGNLGSQKSRLIFHQPNLKCWASPPCQICSQSWLLDVTCEDVPLIICKIPLAKSIFSSSGTSGSTKLKGTILGWRYQPWFLMLARHFLAISGLIKEYFFISKMASKSFLGEE